MLKVGLTGGIACGKSVVRRLLEGFGAFTVDADTIAHDLMGGDSELSGRIANRFGEEVLARDGSVDRKRLGELVFSDPERRGQLNEIVHPLVIEEERRLIEDAKSKGEAVAVVDAALMIEVGTYSGYDAIIVAFCRRELQIERLMKRNGFSIEEATRRVDAQLPAEEKKRYADFLIDTSGTLEETETQVKAAWKELVAMATKKAKSEEDLNAKAQRRKEQ